MSATCDCRERDCENLACRLRYYESHREELLAEQRENTRIARRDAARREYARDPRKRKARKAAQRAIRTGRLIPGPCERAGPDCHHGRIEAHHDDYSKPLEVRWFCTRHHAKHHKNGGIT